MSLQNALEILMNVEKLACIVCMLYFYFNRFVFWYLVVYENSAKYLQTAVFFTSTLSNIFIQFFFFFFLTK